MKSKLRWKLLSSDLGTMIYLWDKTHKITITRNEYNGWLTASLDGSSPVSVEDAFQINDVAKRLGVY